MTIRTANKQASITDNQAIQQAKRRKTWAVMNNAAQQAAANRITFQAFAY